MNFREMACCGVKEIDGLEVSSKKTLLELFNVRPEGDERGAFLVFTDNIVESNKGQNLAKYITRKRLGAISTLKARVNPNTSDKIMVWLWEPNEKRLNNWYGKNN